MLSGLSALSAEEGSIESKRALIEDYGKFSGKVDEELLELASELAKLIAIGGATCADLTTYNEIALAVWKANYRVFTELIRAGADRSTLLSPFQPAFFTVDPGGVDLPRDCALNGSNCESIKIKTPCEGGAISQGVVINASARYSELFAQLQPERPVSTAALNGLGLAIVPAIIWGIAILTAGTAVVILTPKVLGFFDGSTAKQATAELTQARSRLAVASFKARRECIESGGSPGECARSTSEAFKPPAEPTGFLSRVVETTFKLGGLFLVGSFVYKKIQER